MSEHTIGGIVAFSHLSACKIIRVTFHNGDGAVQSIAFSRGAMPSSAAVFSLFSPANTPQQYEMGGFPFPDGFTCTPSDTDVTNIIVEYEDL